jgi:ATP-binding cassette subfamily F protein 3
MVFISHDRYFINHLATKVVEVRDGRLVTHLGGYDDYRADLDRLDANSKNAAPEKREESGAPVARSGMPGAATPPGETGRPGRARRRPRTDPAVRELRRRLDSLEGEIHALEARLAELGTALADPTLYADAERARAVTLERRQAEEHVAWLLHEWETLSEALAAHE